MLNNRTDGGKPSGQMGKLFGSDLTAASYEKKTASAVDELQCSPIEIGAILEMLSLAEQELGKGSVAAGTNTMNRFIANPALFKQCVTNAFATLHDARMADGPASRVNITEEQAENVLSVIHNVYPLIRCAPSPSYPTTGMIATNADYMNFVTTVTNSLKTVSSVFLDIMKHITAANIEGNQTTSTTQNVQRLEIASRINSSGLNRLVASLEPNPDMDDNNEVRDGPMLFKTTAGQAASVRYVEKMLGLLDALSTAVEYFGQEITTTVPMSIATNVQSIGGACPPFYQGQYPTIAAGSKLTVPIINSSNNIQTGLAFTVTPPNGSPYSLAAPSFLFVPQCVYGSSSLDNMKPPEVPITFAGTANIFNQVTAGSAGLLAATLTVYPLEAAFKKGSTTTTFNVGAPLTFQVTSEIGGASAAYNYVNAPMPIVITDGTLTGRLLVWTWEETTESLYWGASSFAAGTVKVCMHQPLQVAIPLSNGSLKWMPAPPVYTILGGTTVSDGSAVSTSVSTANLRAQIESMLGFKYGATAYSLNSVLTELGIVTLTSATADPYVALSTALCSLMMTDPDYVYKTRALTVVSAPFLSQNSTVLASIR